MKRGFLWGADRTLRKTFTICGSKCVPASERICSTNFPSGQAARYGWSERGDLEQSQTYRRFGGEDDSAYGTVAAPSPLAARGRLGWEISARYWSLLVLICPMRGIVTTCYKASLLFGFSPTIGR